MMPPTERKTDHLVNWFYSSEMDFNSFGNAPRGSYMLATIPRSGSTLCAIRFWQTGLLGAPLEYLNFKAIGGLLQRLGYLPRRDGFIPAPQISDYWFDVQRLRTSTNGVFGFKMFIANYVALAHRAPEFLEEISPNYVVYLTRRDVIGQAISYSRAQRSNAWFAGIPNVPDVDYDYEHIKLCLRSIGYQKTAWERAFALSGVSPMRITYEDLLLPCSKVVEDVLCFMGIRPDAQCIKPIPMIEPQTDSKSLEWRGRFDDDSRHDIDMIAHRAK